MRSSTRNGNIIIWFHQFSFLVTGVCSTLGVQWLFYTGAASGSSFFTQLAGCVGSLLAGLVIPILSTQQTTKVTASSTTSVTTPSESVEKGNEQEESHMDGYSVVNVDENNKKGNTSTEGGTLEHIVVARLAIMDMIASAFVTVGFSLIGSGMYQVIFSSVVIWCAILSYLFMRRVLSIYQWIAIFGTSIGLTFCAIDGLTTNTHFQIQQEVVNGSISNDVNGTSSLTFGTLMTIGGTFLYACVYVYADHILSKQDSAPAPIRLCFYNGLYSTLITLIYIILYTMPHLDQLIHLDPVVPHRQIGAMYAFVTLMNACHSWNYYTLLESTGSVATGILQAIRAILVYAISHVWYCATDAAQCFTVNKGAGTLLVIGCVILFTFSSKN
ncbi:hypothetical protein BDA99DRAFT_527114 [Phascolomyces articulosus]|uniref:Uncharacterized protein n=1 Tax=Phascolomyces articulosus TaxID=60185 RepID=A0AAD5P7Y2_9FUNG|nr:hypothetical protein BDA99DRAFT_527114 [Phascolomyces articulosus]